jgi:hypothetical protein
MSGKTAIKSRLSSFVATVPLIADGTTGELTVDSGLQKSINNNEIINKTTHIYISKEYTADLVEDNNRTCLEQQYNMDSS